MEMLGSGMVHRKVIAACGLDPDEWQGFAFGCGIDRLAMLKYGMDDLRAFFDGDLRWLSALRVRGARRAHAERRSWAHEVHLELAQGSSRYRRDARRRSPRR